MKSSSPFMQILLLRHGTASHLLEDFKRKMNWEEFCFLLEVWKKASLTTIGREEIDQKVKELQDNFSHLFYSPLRRTRQSAGRFCENPDILTVNQMPALTEIFILPPKLPKKWKISISWWITLCVIKAFYTFSVVTYIKEARSIIKLIAQSNKDSLVVCHEARIITMLIYALISPTWRILKIDVKPAGLSVIEIRSSRKS